MSKVLKEKQIEQMSITDTKEITLHTLEQVFEFLKDREPVY